MTNREIPAEAVEAAADAMAPVVKKLEALILARAALEAADPHMLAADSTEAKLAAVIIALDPFERVTKWMATEDEVGRYALEAIQKIRTILDGTK